MKGIVRAAATVVVAGAGILMAPGSRADVTSQETFALDLAGVVKAHGSTTARVTSDKSRSDTEIHCEGFMSLFCGNTQSGDIIRLDHNLSWQLNPKKKSYLETPFPTPEERAQAQQKMEQTLKKMQECQKQQKPSSKPTKGDTSDCDLSPPKTDVRTTEEHATIAGHDSRKSSIKVSQTCTDKKTGDVCEFVYGFDVWLTQDQLTANAESVAFRRAYMSKMGLDENSAEFKGAMQQFMAQYSGTMKDLQAKASGFKGLPMRTTFRVIIGGDKCSKSKSDDSDNSGGGGGGLSGLATQGAGKLIGGLFAKKNAPDQSSAAASAANAQPLPPGYVQVVALTVETSAVDTSPIPASEFELPAGWVPEQRKVAKDSEYTCPSNKGE